MFKLNYLFSNGMNFIQNIIHKIFHLCFSIFSYFIIIIHKLGNFLGNHLIEILLICTICIVIHLYKNLYKLIIEHVRNYLVKVDITPDTSVFIDLAVALWKIETKSNNLILNDTDLEKKFKPIIHSIDKIKSILALYNIEYVDYTGQKYNEGMNVEVEAVEENPAIKTPIVKDTISPTILINNTIVKKARIIKEIGVEE